jgi:guanylate kinase
MSEPRSANRDRGRLVVISGPSGSGKTTVCNRLLEDPGVTLSISATTRPPRRDEREGEQYQFLSRDEFDRRVRQGYFAEHAEYNGHLYGTPREEIERGLTAGKTVLLEIDVQGAAQLREPYPDATYIFLDAPNGSAAARLESRNTETAEERRERLRAAVREREAGAKQFDHIVINDDLDETVDRIRALIRGGATAGKVS